MTLDWYDCIRILSAIISLMAMHALGLSFIRRGKDYTTRLKDFWWGMNALLLCLFIGSLENIARDRDFAFVLFVNLFAALVCLKAARSKNLALMKSDSDNDTK